jgi:glycosyltransferase involved in cell wall biosynthesis
MNNVSVISTVVMKLVFIYRKQRPDAFSIEELFRTIARELRKHTQVIEYEVGERSEFFQDLRKLRAMNADVYHLTGDINYFVPLLPKGRTVLTVHDIGHYLTGLKGIKRQFYKWVWLLWPLRAAGAVTCVSDETKRNICTYLKYPANQITVIQNCHSPLFQPVNKAFNSACPTILQVGTKSYKNVPRLVRALRGVNCRLVLIGKIDTELAIMLAQSDTNYVNRVNITHEELVGEYVACDIVSFASIGEGFGVPIIEAQAVGRPLLTSNVSPLCDVAGAGACLVDPLDEASIRHGIDRLISDETYRAELVIHGLVNAQRFSPTATAQRYLDVAQHLAEFVNNSGHPMQAGSK